MREKKVFVSGCFDLLHSGHLAFFEEASQYGKLYVALGSDKTIRDLKGKDTVNNEAQRLYSVKSIKYVENAFISSGSGIIDFRKEFVEIDPDILIVNEDGHCPEKEILCKETNTEYKILKRTPKDDLPAISTTKLRKKSNIPFRIDIAGGWLDQCYVSKFYPGPVITLCIEPTIEFDKRSGMASSTRVHAIELWGTNIPNGHFKKNAKILFCYDNPPGTEVISGSQDSIGIVIPGLNISYYNGKYWPEKIETINDDSVLDFLENHFHFVKLWQRGPQYNPLDNTDITIEKAKNLSFAAEKCWDAILRKDIKQFGHYFSESRKAQVSMFPNMMNNDIKKMIKKYEKMSYGIKLSGAGGGGYLVIISDRKIENSIQIKVRRKEYYSI